METNFGTKIAITGFVWTTANRQLAMEEGLSGRPTKCRYCRYPALKDVAMAIILWLSVGYNFGCMIASDTMFDSRGGFSESIYPMKT